MEVVNNPIEPVLIMLRLARPNCKSNNYTPYHDIECTQVKSIIVIIESVDSISRDGPDTPIYVIQYKNPKYSIQLKINAF